MNIYKQPNGRWKVRMSLGFDETGKRIQLSFSSERKKEVEFWVADQLRKKRDGSIRKVINTRRMNDLFTVWLEDHVRLSKAETTYHSYLNIVKGIPAWFKALQSKEVNPAHAQRLLVEWDKKGLKASTINSRRAIMVGLFSWAKRMEFTDQLLNPFSQVAKLSEGVKDMKTLTANELSEYLNVAKTVMTTGNYAAVMLISYTGMRAREATALRWSDIDFERKRIMVMRTAIETTGGYSFAQTKGKKVRVITIPDIVIEQLHQVRREQKYDQVRLGWRNVEDLVCTGVTGAYLWHSGLRRRHHLTLESADLPAVTLHGLRHTHATLLLEIGTHAKVIQERLGHADAKTTMDTYAHVIHTLQENTAIQFAALLDDKKTAQQSGS